MARKCAKCGKDLIYFTLVLMMGSRGFRRYPVCEKCKAAIEAPPPAPPQMQAQHLERGDKICER
jgi:hypothetical protein